MGKWALKIIVSYLNCRDIIAMAGILLFIIKKSYFTKIYFTKVGKIKESTFWPTWD